MAGSVSKELGDSQEIGIAIAGHFLNPWGCPFFLVPFVSGLYEGDVKAPERPSR